MNRTTLSLIAGVVALAAVTGVAYVTEPSDAAGRSTADAPARLPVERSTLVCPAPTSSDVGETTYTAFTPPADGAAAKDRGQKPGTAQLLPAAATDPAQDGQEKDAQKGGGEPVVPLKEPGRPVTTTADGSDAPALTGTADGRLAPGWSVQQTTVVDAGVGRGLHGTSCTAPDTEFWFPGSSTATDRQDYVHLTNPDDATAVVDLELYGQDGRLEAPSGEAVNVPPHSTVPVLLSTLAAKPEINVTLRVAVRSGRVGAAVQASDTNIGGDWLPPAADPSTSLVLPGIPEDATAVRLVAYAPGGEDADLKVRLAGRSGTFTPAGSQTLHVKSGMTAALDLGDVTKGEPGSLLLSPEGDASGAAPVVAALRITRGKGAKQETAFIPAATAIERRASAADNRAKGSTLSLVAPEEGARVRVTSSAGSEGGTPSTKEITLKGGTTMAVEPPRPAGGKGAYAVTVERLSGGPVHAARTLALAQDGVPMFTVQTLPDDRGTVEVPEAGQDMSLLND
ncbi:DUF5719 family protein [Streptomyces sp. LX-29]|uniref:DUF5719 family protein n=1 Tax=Streptomyces sp. LX-29 TaxID=2900152 RepID=UPI00240D390C|nr:DUF5719 family protein [Streptomyces sp. LX-29]WFB09147.1 DUF5719 family protein [Streptomyces sp. LX-29]